MALKEYRTKALTSDEYSYSTPDDLGTHILNEMEKVQIHDMDFNAGRSMVTVIVVTSYFDERSWRRIRRSIKRAINNVHELHKFKGATFGPLDARDSKGFHKRSITVSAVGYPMAA